MRILFHIMQNRLFTCKLPGVRRSAYAPPEASGATNHTRSGEREKEKVSEYLTFKYSETFLCVRNETRTHTSECSLPPQSSASTNSAIRTSLSSKSLRDLSEKRDSNPRPQPWQGCALPTELFSHIKYALAAMPDFSRKICSLC